eukprot:TRINITY_DN4393_c0_g1_i1.p1 TRINITY_DN4393_c0_g1~~TRINITY_DN4393_c0_g1_i1.p1  ORF type:complete len:235 (-),score=50.67 TRINITY_DN4393_c0_g1_i1:113-817(-)
MNYRRKSVTGVSFDFISYNVLGYACYSVFNTSFFISSGIQEAYRHKHGKSSNDVQANDVFFALHGMALTLITAAQCWIYERGGQTVSKLAMCLNGIGALSIGTYALFVLTDGHHSETGFSSWLQFLYYLSYIKLAVTVIKYIPQVYLNFARKSTHGWTIHNVLLDFIGGFLSVTQMLMDAGVKQDWSSITGDPVKLGLGVFTMIFDLVFIVQHYILYNPRTHHSSSASKLSDNC